MNEHGNSTAGTEKSGPSKERTLSWHFNSWQALHIDYPISLGALPLSCGHSSEESVHGTPSWVRKVRTVKLWE
jgi:hypothetical protein